MTRRRRSRARALALLFLATVMGVLLAVLPGRHHHRAFAGPADAAAPAPPAAGKRGAKDAGALAQDRLDGAPADAAPAATSHAGPPAAKIPTAAESEAPSIPMGKGLPVLVNVAVYFQEVAAFDDSKGEFECTTDIRLRWTDLRLRYPEAQAFSGYREFRGKEADAQLGKIWTPNVEVINRVEGSSPYVSRRVRIFPDGTVESIARASARYKTHVSAESFPFDRQHLRLDLRVREQTTDEVLLRYEKEDVEFSRAAAENPIEGWEVGLVDLRAHLVRGWNGDRYSEVRASLLVDRVASTGLAPIFIPLVASLLIPLLALWMNRASREGFEVEAFELANMGIGGLFSVIALSFAIYTSFPVIAGSDNTVTRLFGLNYATLALSLAIVVLLFRFDVVRRSFGPHVHEEVFRFLCWALPLLTLATSVAFLLVAAS